MLDWGGASEGKTMLVLRQARLSDHPRLLELARELNSINLPAQPEELKAALRRSRSSFAGRMRDRARAVYLFCAEERSSGKLLGASMIIAKHGTPEAPHYYLEMDSDERYSHTLKRLFRHTYLRLRYSMDGPTELGGLIVTRSARGRPEQAGKQISWVRFLYLATHRARFEPRVVAEMLAPSEKTGGNAFWDHYGRRVTGLSFREADKLSTRDKEFIRALFPDSPLYTFLLPKAVQRSLGAVGAETVAALRLLEKAGMRFLGHIDPFDAGPYLGAATDDLVAVRQCRRFRAVAGAVGSSFPGDYLVGCEDRRGFRAVRTAALAGDSTLTLPADSMAALGVKQGAAVAAVALP